MKRTMAKPKSKNEEEDGKKEGKEEECKDKTILKKIKRLKRKTRM